LSVEWVTIGPHKLACGDCLEILSEIEGVDAVVTDPPYGINWKGHASRPEHLRGELVIGDDKPFDPAPLLSLDVPMVLWGANNYASRLPDSPNWLVWTKRGEGCQQKDHGGCEVAWTRGMVRGGCHAKRFIWDGNIREKDYEMRRLHPSQKPVTIMRWCVGFTPDDCVVFDPYMGSGSTSVACQLLGRKFIGVETDRRYFDVACERLEAAMAEEPLLAEAG
jgi:site-specific DNA-methyltransferase (adenine-specific)